MAPEAEFNGRQMAIIATNLDNLTKSMDKLAREWSQDHDQIKVNTVRLGYLENKPIMVCPKHDALADQIDELRLAMAKAGFLSGASGGVTVSVIAGVVFGIGKAAGWW